MIQFRAYNFDAGAGPSASDFFINRPAVVDPIAPTFTTVAIASNNANAARARVGDTITLNLTASESLTAAPTVTIGGSAATVTGSGASWSATRAMTIGDTEGTVAFVVSGATDLAGNAMAGTVTATTNASSVTFDRTAPTASALILSSTLQVEGGIVVSYTASDANGVAESRLYARNDRGLSWTGAGAVSPATSGTTIYPAPASGVYYFAVVATDAAGNTGVAPSGSTGVGAASVTYNAVANSAFEYAVPASGGLTILTFPMEDGLSLTLGFPSVTTGGTVSVSRTESAANGAGLSTGALINQFYSITPSGGFAFPVNASEVLGYEDSPAILNSLDPATDFQAVFRVNGSTFTVYTGTAITVDTVAKTVTVTGFDGFSDFYIGRNAASVEDWILLGT